MAFKMFLGSFVCLSFSIAISDPTLRNGTFFIDVPNLYPESADYDYINSKLYVSSTSNNSVFEYDISSGSSKELTFSGITSNPEYLVCGIDYSSTTQDIYISANARAPFFTNGANLTGPNTVIRYSRSTSQVIYRADMSPILNAIQTGTGYIVGGFQDQAEDLFGNAYYMATWGNLLVKVTPGGKASQYYLPSRAEINSTSPGFGGLFALDNKLIVSDAITGSFAVFDTTCVTGKPTFVYPSNVPAGYSPFLCDSLYTPPKYHGEVALCADDWVQGVGGIVVYQSNDGWESAKYVGLILNDKARTPGSTATATFEIGGKVFTSQAFLPNADGTITQTESFPFVDITEEVEGLLQEA